MAKGKRNTVSNKARSGGNFLSDRPIPGNGDDALDRRAFAAKLCRALVDSTSGGASGVTIALTGQWGSGKSTVLNFVEAELSKHAAIVFRFDPWIFSGSASLTRQFLDELSKTISGSAKKKSDKFVAAARSVAEYARPFAAIGDVLMPGAGLALGAALDGAAATPHERSLHELRAEAEAALSKLEVPVIAIIDDLDRLVDDEILEMCKLIRAVADFRSMSYLIAYDREQIEIALSGTRDESKIASHFGGKYLEKIVQIQIPLPATESSELALLFDAGIRELVLRGALPRGADTNEFYKKVRDTIVTVTGQCTPRDITRTTMTFAPIVELVGGEIFWADLLAFSHLTSKYPIVVDMMRSKTDWFVDDPARVTVDVLKSLEGRDSHDPKVRKTFWDSLGIPIGAGPLVRLLFPALSERSTQPTDGPTRLSKRRCLRTALRLGYPPGTFSNTYMRAFAGSQSTEVHETLEACDANGSVVDLLDRLSETIAGDDGSLFANCDQETAFWVELCKFLNVRTNGVPTVERIGQAALLESIVEALLQRGNGKAFPQDLPFLLLRHGNIEVVSALLRHQFLKHGLFDFELTDARSDLIGKDKTIELATNFAEAVIALHKSNSLLGSALSPGPYFLLFWMKRWTDEQRLQLDHQLQENQELDDFVAIGWRPSTRLTGEGVARICDVNHFKARVSARLSELKSTDDTSGLRSLYERVLGW